MRIEDGRSLQQIPAKDRPCTLGTACPRWSGAGNRDTTIPHWGVSGCVQSQSTSSQHVPTRSWQIMVHRWQLRYEHPEGQQKAHSCDPPIFESTAFSNCKAFVPATSHLIYQLSRHASGNQYPERLFSLCRKPMAFHEHIRKTFNGRQVQTPQTNALAQRPEGF